MGFTASAGLVAAAAVGAAAGVAGELAGGVPVEALPAEVSAAVPGRVISTLPRKRAPSSMRKRRASTLPCTWLAGPMRTLSRACKFPCTLPSISISRRFDIRIHAAASADGYAPVRQVNFTVCFALDDQVATAGNVPADFQAWPDRGDGADRRSHIRRARRSGRKCRGSGCCLHR